MMINGNQGPSHRLKGFPIKPSQTIIEDLKFLKEVWLREENSEHSALGLIKKFGI